MTNEAGQTFRYLLRVEAVNLEHVIEDTNQLSAVRGGAYLALEAAKRLGEELATQSKGAKITVLSHGASVALLEIEDRSFATVPTDAVACLRKKYPHHTFVVDIQPLADAGDFVRAREAVLARNRFRQLRQPSLAVPSQDGEGPCALDDIRPANEKWNKSKEIQHLVSVSVDARMKKGREMKRQLPDFLGLPPLTVPSGEKLGFASEFGEIAGEFEDERLRNKLAVIYVDGNHFSARQDACRNANELQRFDEALRKQREQWLHAFLEKAWGDAEFCLTHQPGKGEEPTKILRFELLLWGGDEMLLIVPAWKGLETIADFYRASAGWRVSGDAGHRLTHAGALVFCNAKTPIDRMAALARELSETVKKQGRDEDRFEYLILESVDYPVEPVETFWRATFGAAAETRRALDPAGIQPPHLETLRACADHGALPWGKLLRGVRDLAVDPDRQDRLEEKWSGFQTLLDATREASKEAQIALEELGAALEQAFPEQADHWRWLHLTDLLDYLPKPKQEAPCATMSSPSN